MPDVMGLGYDEAGFWAWVWGLETGDREDWDAPRLRYCRRCSCGQ